MSALFLMAEMRERWPSNSPILTGSVCDRGWRLGLWGLAWNRTGAKFSVVRIWFLDLGGNTLTPVSLRR